MSPLSAKQSSLPVHSVVLPMLQAIRRPLAGLMSIHNAYGELVLGRFFNRKLLFVCNPEHIEQLFSYEAKGLLSRDFIHDAKKSIFGNGLINSQTEVWSKQRRLMQPLFTKEAVGVWEDIIADEAAASALALQSAAQQPIDMTAAIKNLIQRIFVRILLGKPVATIP